MQFTLSAVPFALYPDFAFCWMLYYKEILKLFLFDFLNEIQKGYEERRGI